MNKEDKYRELIRLQGESNLSVLEFCHNQGIAPSTYYYWFKKFKREHKGQSKQADFIPLMVKDNQSLIPAHVQNRNNYTAQQQDQSVGIELVYPNGVVLRIKSELDLASLRSLIQLQE